MEKIKVRGLVRSAGWIFVAWGGLVAVKGFWDVFLGEPEANYYSLNKWDFVSQKQWLTWSGFEITYGLACVAIALVLWKYAPRLPEFIEKRKEKGQES
ncbi:MAG: hypothetical protein JW803_08775 [Endomicrobiales bacterium]|nr:hypothetical protein [Endomicrobiales bacterium]